MEETEEYKWAVKVVIKRQMRDLIEQLQEAGEEVAILAVDLDYDQCTHFGSPTGEWFMSEQRSLTKSFLNFCKTKNSKKAKSSREKRKADPTKWSSRPSSSCSPVSKSMSPRVVLQKLERGNSEINSPVVRMWVPSSMAEGICDVDLAVVCGRLLATRLETGSTSPMKLGPPSAKRTRSGRAVSSSFLNAVGALKKSGASTNAAGLNHSTEFSQDTLKRFEFCTLSGEVADIQGAPKVDAEKLEGLTASVGPALDDFLAEHDLPGNHSKVKVIVAKSSYRAEVGIDFESVQSVIDQADTTEDDDPDFKMEISDGDDFDDYTEDQEYLPDDEEKCEVKTAPIDFQAYIKEMNKSPATGVNRQAGDGRTTYFPKEAVARRIRQKMQQNKTRLNKTKPKRVKPLMECEQCGMKLAGRHNLKNHVDRVHLKIRNEKCPICSKGFWSKSCIENHTISVHTRQCETCQEYVVESTPWEEGVTAKTVRKVQCVCGASVIMYTKLGLKSARELQGNDYSEGDLTSGHGRMFACGECGKLFAKKSECEKHAVMHSTVRNFICDFCGLAVKSKVNLLKHMAREHALLTNACEACGKNYNSAKALKNHMAAKHPKWERESDTSTVQTVLEPTLASLATGDAVADTDAQGSEDLQPMTP